MRLSTSTRRFLATLGAAGLLAFGAGSSAHAQQVLSGGTPGWSGYAPAATWGVTAPSVGGYAPQASVPAYTYAPPATAWQGYAPATAWQGYAPTTAWQGYTPGYPAQATAPRPAAAASRSPISRTNREYGTGRSVHMHKPWLPSSPR